MCVAKVKGNENPTKAIKHCYNDHPITFTNGLSEKIDNDSSYIFFIHFMPDINRKKCVPMYNKINEMAWHGHA